MKKKLFVLPVFILTIFLILFLTACSAHDVSKGVAKNDYPISIYGATLKEKPQRVAVFSQNISDIILTCRLEATLVARSLDTTQQDLSSLPAYSVTDIESIKALSPDLIMIDKGSTDDDTLSKLKQICTVAEIPLPTSREELVVSYAVIASALNGGNNGYQTGERTANQVLMSLDEYTRLIPSATRPTACYIYSIEGNTATAAINSSLAGKMLEYAGTTNNYGDWETKEVNLEALVYGNPEYIFVDSKYSDIILQDSAFSAVSAVVNQNVYTINSSAMSRYGKTMAETVAMISKTIYRDIDNGAKPAPKAVIGGSVETPSNTTQMFVPLVPTTIDNSIKTEGILQLGDSGNEVKWVQERLDYYGYATTKDYDGYFGATTKNWVESFQLKNNLAATGVINEQTAEALHSETANRK